MACSTLRRLYDQQECGILHVKVGGDMVGKLTEHRLINRSLYKNPKRFSSPNPTTKQAARKPIGNQGEEDENGQ